MSDNPFDSLPTAYFSNAVSTTYLFPVVKALIVIFQGRGALLLAGLALARVHNIASKNLLPEGVAATGAYSKSHHKSAARSETFVEEGGGPRKT